MPKGGRRSGAGKKGLSLEEKLAISAMVDRVIEEDFPRRYARAFAKATRSSHRDGRHAPELGELNEHYDDIRLPPRRAWEDMTPEEREGVMADRRDYSKQHSAAPTETPIGSMFAKTRIPRSVSVPPPTDIEMGQIHEAVAEAMAQRLGRPVTRRQVAEARRYISKLLRDTELLPDTEPLPD